MASSAVGADEVRLSRGAGDFVFTDAKGDPRSVTVYTYVPRRVDMKDAPIVFIMHGFHRSARSYRDDWAQHADRAGFIVIAPRFDAKRWGKDYTYPSTRRADGSPRDMAQTSFGLVEHLFDAVRASVGSNQTRYRIYGFSEGGQFVHRLVLTLPDARYARAVIGTPGWYTMPDFDVGWPYGLRHTQTDRAALKKILERDVVLLLGGADNDPSHDELRKTPQAMAQGVHRVERGENFFREARARAAELGAHFAWCMEIVPGVAHEPKKMSPTAAAYIAMQPAADSGKVERQR